MISTMRPQYTGWHPSLVIPEYRYLSNKLLFATEFGWAGQSITINNGTTGPLDLISGKRANTAGAQYSQNSYGLSNFGTHFNFGDTFSNGFAWPNSQNLGWWVNARDDIPVTIEGLVYLDSSIADTFTNNIMYIGVSAGRITFTLYYETDHWELSGERATDNSYQRARSSDSFPTDRWVHVVSTIPAYGFGAPELYIDSKIPNYVFGDPRAGSGNSGTQTDTKIEISNYSGGQEFRGKMAYIRVYQGVLTQDDVNKLYADPFGILRQSPRGFEWVERRPTIRVRARGRG